MRSTLLRNARLLDPWTGRDERGHIVAIDGKIVAVGPEAEREAPEGAVLIECDGHCLAPGLIDMRVHLAEPGHEHLENIAIASQAASAGGITSLVALPDTDPVIDDMALVEFITRRAQKVGLVNIYAYGAATRRCQGKELAEIGLMAQAGAVGFTDATRAVSDAMTMRRLLSYARTFDQLIVQHPEDPSLAGMGCATEGELATRLGLPGMSSMAEVILVERDLRLVEITGARYHVAHISTAEAVDVVRKAKVRGLPVTCDTAPAYFTLNENAIDRYRTFAKLSPPLRSETDRRAIVEGLKDGTIDAIASDHRPEDQDAKRLPFAAARPGIVGLETLLPLTLALYHEGHLSLLKALRTVTQAPADLLRLPIARLAIGASADLVLFDLDRPRQIKAAAMRSKIRNTPFDGHPVQGQVLRTIVAGRTSYTAAELTE